ncbi:OVARIAN TUMOR DOMAIN-containing deubiquitinating enzyme 9 [Physcomitrium patens]|uniref:ubiquitinyl hydrolase 1 n=1 Tax=Physcomitrium patens TaxID=3218 RepID=A0A2K1K9Y4_PHYPA|nr:OTU domain-containing protein 5-B-like isoform X2 [Physcomitrium patens]PNR50595.1 hypothetical protein PHYPA_009781 [Physcomitrium patens]|eukprot:XP_024381135.1 OTU domain-containing protein 5-B-like isoform X2 [Physcomitrella patens]
MVRDDLVRWGLHELEGSGYVANDAGTSGTASVNVVVETTVQNNYDPTAPVLYWVNEGIQVAVGEVVRAEEVEQNEEISVPFQFSPPPIPPSPTTANDAVIAQALHEEFQKLAAAEAAGQACAKDKEAVLVQNWVESAASDTSSGEGSSDPVEKGASASSSASVGNPYGHVTVHYCENSKEDMDRRNTGSLSNPSTVSSSQDPYSLDDDDRQMALALSEEYQRLDREVANRLTKLESLKHVPRTNQSFPTYEDASADHQRLLDRLVLYGLTEQKIKGDGNCQFRALSDQLYRNPELHKYVRKLVVKQLKANPEVYSNYVPMKYSDYLKKMAKNSEWGDHVTLQAASDHFGVKISLITSFRDTCFIEIIPEQQKSPREIYLSFWAEIHYNSIYPVGSYYQDTHERHGKKRNLLAKIFD